MSSFAVNQAVLAGEPSFDLKTMETQALALDLAQRNSEAFGHQNPSQATWSESRENDSTCSSLLLLWLLEASED